MGVDRGLSPAELARDPRIASRTLSVDRVHEVAGTRRLAELRPRNTRFVPIEAMLEPASRLAVLRDAVEAGVRVLLVEGVIAELGQALHAELPGIVIRLDEGEGDDTDAGLHGIRVSELLRLLLRRDPATVRAFSGMSDLHAHSDALRLLGEEADLRRAGLMHRILSNPKFLAYAIVFVYSSLRALVVTFVPEFQGSLWVLWFIDVATAIPYTWGVLTMLFAPRPAVRLCATAVTLATFAAPYVYFWTQGSDYPPYVAAVIAALTLFSVLIELAKFVQERALRDRYVSATPALRTRDRLAASASAPGR